MEHGLFKDCLNWGYQNFLEYKGKLKVDLGVGRFWTLNEVIYVKIHLIKIYKILKICG